MMELLDKLKLFIKRLYFTNSCYKYLSFLFLLFVFFALDVFLDA